MHLNCRLGRNITLSGSDIDNKGCGSTALVTGGIRPTIYLYNIDDVQNLQFENDSRADDNLMIDTIIASDQFFYIDASSVQFNSTQSGDKYTHVLTLTLPNIATETEDILNEAINSKYLVAFCPNGEEFYRVFGWKKGADLSYTLEITETDANYKIEISITCDYPLFSCYADNFNLKNKTFTPIFKPLYNIAFCELSGSVKTGYAIASYVVKVNSAGLALDKNNMLCSYSGLLQDAYKYTGVSADGGYNVLGTYSSTAYFDGKPVKVFDTTLCPPNASGTITISPTTIKLNSNTTTAPFTLTSANAWRVLNTPLYVTVSPNSGSGDANGNFISNGNGGTDVVVFQNRTTYEQVQVIVNSYFIKVGETINLPNGVNNFQIAPVVEGGSKNYSYTTPAGLSITKTDGILLCTVATPSATEQTYIITLTHADDNTETKTITITISASDAEPVWVEISRFCQTQ